MRSRTLWVFVAGVMLCAFSTRVESVSAAERPADTSKALVDRASPTDDVSSENLTVVFDPDLQPVLDNLDVPSTSQVELFPLPPGTTFTRHVVGGDGTTAVAESVIYSNTEGKSAAKFPSGYLVADDISTTAAVDCPLTRFTFEVTGQADPDLPAAPYTITWALYSNCPGAVSASYRPTIMIAGTNGSQSFPDGAARTIEFTPAAPVLIPTSFWLAISVIGDNAGPIMGAPALEGFTGDVFDYPGFACNSNLGGFPNQPHASFNAEFFGNSCPPRHLGYKAQRASGNAFNPGRNVWFSDDLQLITDQCKMTACEIGVKGTGRYYLEVRSACTGAAITGTQQTLLVGACAGGICEPQVRRFTFDPPIPLPQNPWFAIQINNATAGVIVAGRQADIGQTQDFYGVQLPDGTCDLRDIGEGIHSAIHVSITCEGEAPRGACCDMYVTDENDDAVCREVAKINCPFPPVGTGLRPAWKEGAACDPNPFVEGICGQAACCYKDVNEDELCTNYTKNQCNAVPPLENARQWQSGRFCSLDGQRCPLNACLARQLPCTRGHNCGPDVDPEDYEPGCQDPTCCTDVCNEPWQDFCCNTCWDDECALVAQDICTIPPSNDECVGGRPGEGATLLTIPQSITTEGVKATENETDPAFCCHTGLPLVCMTPDGQTSFSCVTDDDCALGYTCQERPPVGLKTVWYKFRAPQPPTPGAEVSVQLSTCQTGGTNVNSLLQAFSVGNPTSDETACNSLSLIGCSDDRVGCANGGKNGWICLRNLVPGDLYYVMVAAKTHETENVAYKLNITNNCTDTGAVANDYCQGALPVTNGATAFNMTGATMHCPGDICAPGMEKDLWYEYTATCTGYATVDTCSGTVQPDTNLVVYEGCDLCPSSGTTPKDCNRDSDECDTGSLASSVTVPVANGECYKVRVGNQEGSNPIGQLTIGCVPVCGQGTVTFIDPINGTTDARRPHSPASPLPAMGIDTIVATAPAGAAPLCWRLCETQVAGGEPNSIAGVVEAPPGTYTISLARPITADAYTTIRYLGNAALTYGRFYSHPGNTKDDFAVTYEVVQLLVDTLYGYGYPPWGEYSEDIDRSGILTPLDILDVVDILNGADAYTPRNGTAKPSSAGCPLVP